MRDDFERWLLDNWGFLADQVTPICNTPPLFVLPNGFFDVAAYDDIQQRHAPPPLLRLPDTRNSFTSVCFIIVV